MPRIQFTDKWLQAAPVPETGQTLWSDRTSLPRGRTLCLPWLRWVHRFGRPAGVPYPLYVEDKLRNYLIGFIELGWDPAPALEHFAADLSPEKIARVQAEAQAIVISGPGYISGE